MFYSNTISGRVHIILPIQCLDSYLSRLKYAKYYKEVSSGQGDSKSVMAEMIL